MKTTIIIEIEHKNPIQDLLDKVANRAWTLQGVDGVTVSIDNKNLNNNNDQNNL